ncbi:MAG TPA: cupin domain-containing protein [Polyangiaceae bacterium]|nr:cupin domain-containing protein [Polyangiaceae bacterium]
MNNHLPPQLFDRSTPHDRRDALFGGQGTVRVWALLAAPALPFTAVLACELEPGASVGVHVQQEYPELVICISGRGHVAVGGVASEFCAGKVVELPHGQTLAIDNRASAEPLRYLIIKAS